MADQFNREDEELNQASLNEQAGLILYIEKILERHRLENHPREKYEYANFSTIRAVSETENDTGHLSLTKFITKPKSLMNLLQLIFHVNRSSQQASIDLMDICIPRINFYKVFENNELTFKIPFGQLTDEQRENYKKNHSNIDMSLNEGVYLTAFKADFKGSNPAEINSNIEAEATIFFTDAALLTDEIIATTGQINTDKENKDKKFNWIDILAPGGNPCAKASDYKIKVEIGYDFDEHAARAIYKDVLDTTIQFLKEGMKRMTTILYLIPVSHNIKFDRETIEFTVQYQAAISQDMKKLDIFLASPEKASLIGALNRLEDLAQQKEKKSNEIKDSIASDKDKEEKSKKMEEGSGALGMAGIDPNSFKYKEEEIKKGLEVVKNQVYSTILRQIVGLEPKALSKKPSKTGVYNLVVDPATLGLNEQGKINEAPASGTSPQPFYELPKRILGHWPISNLITTGVEKDAWGWIDDNSAKTLTGQQQTTGENFSFRELSTGVQKEKTDSQEIAQRVAYNRPPSDGIDYKIFQSLPQPANKKYLMAYMFLGDILDVACTCVRTMGRKSVRPRIIFGNIKISIPLKDPKKPNAGVENTKELYINLADIPISYNLFQSFYINKLIKDRPTEIKLDFFINSIMNELLIPALGPSYFGDEAGFSNNQIKISSVNLNIPYTVTGNDVFTGQSKDEIFSGIINLSEFKNKIDNLNISDDLTKGSGDYIIYFDSTPPKKLLERAADEDLNKRKLINFDNGIMHLTAPPFGRGGLVGLEFNKVDIEGAREAAVLNDGNGGSRLLSLKQVYEINATYEPGLPFYRPGDIIFVEPYYGGDKAVSLLSRDLGVEGYYQVISMSLQYNFTTIKTVLKGTIIGIVNKGGKLENRRNSKC